MRPNFSMIMLYAVMTASSEETSQLMPMKLTSSSLKPRETAYARLDASGQVEPIKYALANRESSAAASMVSLSLRSIITTDVQPLKRREENQKCGHEMKDKVAHD